MNLGCFYPSWTRIEQSIWKLQARLPWKNRPHEEIGVIFWELKCWISDSTSTENKMCCHTGNCMNALGRYGSKQSRCFQGMQNLCFYWVTVDVSVLCFKGKIRNIPFLLLKMTFGCVPNAIQSRLLLPTGEQSCTPSLSLWPMKVNTKTLQAFVEEQFLLCFEKSSPQSNTRKHSSG